jgi:hypothetical protein
MTGDVAALPRTEPETGARTDERAAPPRREVSRWLPAIAFVLVMAVTLWILSPRFQAHFPSLVDDWFAIHNGPSALSHLVHLDYSPEKVHDPRRFRPGFQAIWNWLQWQTLDAPGGGMVGPNLWNILRVAALTGGVMLLVVLGAPAGRRRTWWTTAAAALAALVLVSIPAMMFEIARFGPGEPLLVGAMVVGGTLLVAGTARWIRGARWTAVVPALVGGYLLWLLGVFMKEASICFLALAPFLWLELSRRARAAHGTSRPLWREPRAIGVAALAVVPVLYMLYQVKKIAGGGKTVYGADIPSNASGFADRLHDAFLGQWAGIQAEVGTPLMTGLAVAAGAAVLASGATRRRVPWLGIGLVVTAWVVLVFQGLGGEFAPRYYLPTIALFLAAIAVALLDAPVALRTAAAVAGALFVLTHIGTAHRVVNDIGVSQARDAASVKNIAELHPGRCPVYLAGMPAEFADAIPVLVELVPGHDDPGCVPGGWEAVLIRGGGRAGAATDERINDACASPGGWQRIRTRTGATLLACRRLKTGQIRGRDVRDVLRQDRIVPGVGLSEHT